MPRYLFLILLPFSLFAGSAQLNFEFKIREVAYLQWIEKPRDKVSFEQTVDVVEFPTYTDLLVETAGPQEVFLGVICNTLAGYRIQIQAFGAVGKTMVEGMANNGTALRYQLDLEPLYSTFGSGAETEVELDATGQTDSVVTHFSSPEDLPLSFYGANVYRLRAQLQRDDNTEFPEFIDYYEGSITATVYLP